MLHLLRAELYRHPRRMMVLVSLAVLLVIAATNAFSIFQPSLAEEREKLHILASAGARPERLAEIARDNWHYRFVQSLGTMSHMLLFTLLLVNIPLAVDLSARRNDELTALGFTPAQIYLSKTLAAIPGTVVCYLIVLLTSFLCSFASAGLYGGSITGAEWLVMLQITGITLLWLLAFILGMSAIPFLVQNPIVSFLGGVGLGFGFSLRLPVRQLLAVTRDDAEYEALVTLFQGKEIWELSGRYLPLLTVSWLALGLLVYVIGFAVYCSISKRKD